MWLKFYFFKQSIYEFIDNIVENKFFKSKAFNNIKIIIFFPLSFIFRILTFVIAIVGTLASLIVFPYSLFLLYDIFKNKFSSLQELIFYPGFLKAATYFIFPFIVFILSKICVELCLFCATMYD